MRNWHLVCVLAVAVLVAFSPARVSNLKAADVSKLEWDQEKVTLRIPQGDRETRIEWVARNVGRQPIRIKSVQSDCKCLGVDAERKLIAPGEAVKIVGLMMLSDGTFDIQRRVVVEMEDGGFDILGARVIREFPVTLSSNYLLWRIGSPAETKKLILSAEPDDKIEKITWESEDTEIVVKMEEGARKGEEVLSFEPKSTSAEVNGAVTIRLKSKKHGDAWMDFPIFVK